MKRHADRLSDVDIEYLIGGGASRAWSHATEDA
jgi:hypothetical protein